MSIIINNGCAAVPHDSLHIYRSTHNAKLCILEIYMYSSNVKRINPIRWWIDRGDHSECIHYIPMEPYIYNIRTEIMVAPAKAEEIDTWVCGLTVWISSSDGRIDMWWLYGWQTLWVKISKMVIIWMTEKTRSLKRRIVHF